jgi:hypothetical protein
MFKKFGKEEISGYTQVKASVARGIRCEQQKCNSSSSRPALMTGQLKPSLLCLHSS